MSSEIDSTQQSANNLCLENTSQDCYVFDVPEGLEFRCDICDVVYHSKEVILCTVLVVCVCV